MKGLNTRALVTHLVTHPGEIPMVSRAAWRLRRDGWWHRAPFLPLPGRDYWKFRLATSTGSVTGITSVPEVIEYAKWSDLQRAKG